MRCLLRSRSMEDIASLKSVGISIETISFALEERELLCVFADMMFQYFNQSQVPSNEESKLGVPSSSIAQREKRCKGKAGQAQLWINKWGEEVSYLEAM